MDLKDYLAISGKPGLYKFISQGRNAMVVENLETGIRSSAFATDKVSALADIAIFTEDEEVPLQEVLKSIFEKENGASSISHKSDSQQLKDWFESILPEYDKERVYTSDMKKIAQWYNILHKLELLDFSEKEEDIDTKEKPDAEKQAEPEKPDGKKTPKKQPEK